MKSVWKANYGNNKIEVINTWFNGERLFVNGQLQDEKLSFLSADLSGHLTNEKGEKETIKVNLSGYFTIGCRLFVNDAKIPVQKVA